MADIADIANEKIQAEMDAALKYRPAVEDIRGTGACLYCRDALSFDQRWCDSDCRDDWERQQKAVGAAVEG